MSFFYAFPPASSGEAGGDVGGGGYPFYPCCWWPPPGSFGGYPNSNADGGGSVGGSHGGMSRTAILTPVIIATVALVGSAVLLITYYRVFARYCSAWQIMWGIRRPRRDGAGSSGDGYGGAGDMDHGFFSVAAANTGLEESIVKKIPVFRFSEGIVSAGSECAVCLGEFQDDDELRLLPKCSHAFHLECIDIWLRTHSNCPLCRAMIVAPIRSGGPGGDEAEPRHRHLEQDGEHQQAQDELVLTLGVEGGGEGAVHAAIDVAAPRGEHQALGFDRSSSSLDDRSDRNEDREKQDLRRCYSTGSRSMNKEGTKEEGFVVLNIELGSSSSSSSRNGDDGDQDCDHPRSSSSAPLKKSSSLRASLMSAGGKVFSFHGLRSKSQPNVVAPPPPDGEANPGATSPAPGSYSSEEFQH